MMTLLNRVKMLVNPYLQDNSMELGYNSFEVSTDFLALDLEFEHYIDYVYPRGKMDVVIKPVKVVAYVGDGNGDFDTEEDLTGYFEPYTYSVS